MQAWLIEYVGAIPVPVYAPDDLEQMSGFPTCNPWAARRFRTKAEAEAWMKDHNYSAPWIAMEHGFEVKCMYCGKDPGFTPSGDSGLCDNCIPF